MTFDVASRRHTSLLAYGAAVLFAALFASIGAQAPPPISPLLGLFGHLVLLPVVAALPAPPWARAAGYGWLIGDVVLNVAAWNVGAMRLGPADAQLITTTFES